MRLFVSVTNENVKDWYTAGDSWLLGEYASLEELADAVAAEITDWLHVVDVNAVSPAKVISLRLDHTYKGQQYGAAHYVLRKEWDYLIDRASALETLIDLLVSMIRAQERAHDQERAHEE